MLKLLLFENYLKKEFNLEEAIKKVNLKMIFFFQKSHTHISGCLNQKSEEYD